MKDKYTILDRLERLEQHTLRACVNVKLRELTATLNISHRYNVRHNH